jgi:hypothetical protein
MKQSENLGNPVTLERRKPAPLPIIPTLTPLPRNPPSHLTMANLHSPARNPMPKTSPRAPTYLTSEARMANSRVMNGSTVSKRDFVSTAENQNTLLLTATRWLRPRPTPPRLSRRSLQFQKNSPQPPGNSFTG